MKDKKLLYFYPAIKNSLFLCFIFFAVQIFLGIVLELIRVSDYPAISETSVLYGIMMMIISLVSLFIPIYYGFRKTKTSFKEVFKVRNISLKLWIYGIIFSCGFVIVSSEIDNIINFFLPMPLILEELFFDMAGNKSFIIALTLLVLIPAFGEEMFFRGVILHGFEKNYSVKKAVFVNAFLFGAIHLNPWQFLTGFIIGAISAWAAIKTKSIFLSIYIHFFNNCLFLLCYRFEGFIPIPGFNSSYERGFQPLWFTALGLVITLFSVYLFIKQLKKEKEVIKES